jgi:transcriptional regulator with PAS, ATPase and Fis domain
VGGLKDIEVDIRVIAASNLDIERASREGKFRRDLYYRLNVCPLFIPPLRDRRDDIIPLTDHFISHFNTKFRKKIQDLSSQAKKLFLNYQWPGNVRELKNAIERAMIFEEDKLISPKYLPIHLNGGGTNLEQVSLEGTFEEDFSYSKMEKKLIVNALTKAKGNKSQAARILKITRDTLRYKIKKFNIKPEHYSFSS